tara:strand:- start:1416 stop:2120 length:705 start_codon:yes stop_codon:yes gene_type:complete
MKKRNKIIFTGGSGKFGRVFKRIHKKKEILYPTSNQLNIKNYKSIKKYLSKFKPKYFIHTAALSRPMSTHDKNIVKSIETNIIGTCNVVRACSEKNIKLIYFSSNYVYPSKQGYYDEESAVLPFNNYAWSKLGGEAAVQMYKNSLILRICMTEKPFLYKKAYTNLKTNFMFHEDLAEVFFKLINNKGIINVGGKSQNVYNFAKKYNKDIKKGKLNHSLLPLSSTMNIRKFRKLT